jgi:crossover junction endodeoxyribonuclease RuvC
MSNNHVYIGIDCGLSGAVAVIDQDGEIMALVDTPTTTIKSGKKNKNVYRVQDMVQIFKPYFHSSLIVNVAIESQFAMAGQGVSSTFSTGRGYGLWEGIVAALGFSYSLVTSQKWKKEIMCGMGKEKAASCVKAQQLYPTAELFTARGRALDGRGDALLIAAYLKQQSI